MKESKKILIHCMPLDVHGMENWEKNSDMSLTSACFAIPVVNHLSIFLKHMNTSFIGKLIVQRQW
jgi:hypothetical protein